MNYTALTSRRGHGAAARRQGGVAVVTALLLTTLAVTIVASVFWQQQVQVRSVENQRLQSQTQWVLRAALDWTRIILREDARNTSVDQLGEPWATPLPETRLDDYVDADGGQTSPVTLSGNVVDAQSRYNLSNLALGGTPNMNEIAVFRRLLASLRLDPSLAQATATAIAATEPLVPQAAINATNGVNLANSTNPGAPPPAAASAPAEVPAKAAQLLRIDDLITIPGYSPAIIEKIRDFVVILPVQTPVNVNTAGPEVLAAKMNLSRDAVDKLVATRNQAYFLNAVDFQTRAQIKTALNDGDIDVKTDYFMVYSKVRMERANLAMQALIYRKKTGNTTIMWLREY
ncbi:MAG TPA: type II secretion system minor pseudopilin GspK [Burkholderiaceae bacterium]